MRTSENEIETEDLPDLRGMQSDASIPATSPPVTLPAGSSRPPPAVLAGGVLMHSPPGKSGKEGGAALFLHPCDKNLT